MSLNSFSAWRLLNYSKRLLKFLVGLRPIGCFLKLEIFPTGLQWEAFCSGWGKWCNIFIIFRINIMKIFSFQARAFSILSNYESMKIYICSLRLDLNLNRWIINITACYIGSQINMKFYPPLLKNTSSHKSYSGHSIQITVLPSLTFKEPPTYYIMQQK